MPLTDEQIATELRALRETPSEEFSAELDAWAAAGFPAREANREADHRAQSRRALTRVRGFRLRQLTPAIAPLTALAAIVLVVVGLSSISPGGEDSDDGGDAGGIINEMSKEQGRSGDESGSAPGTAAPDAAVEPASPTTVPPSPPREQLRPGQPRIQEKNASMTLSTDHDDVDDVADEVVDVVDRYEGIVVASEVNMSEERSRATFDLRIPTANLQATLSDLSDLASVSSRDEGTLDITAPFITAEETFDDAKAEVDALLGQLAEADSASEIASIRSQLAAARADLSVARSALADLKRRADFSKLSLTVVGDGDADGWSLGDAADDAVNVFEDVVGAGLVVFAVIAPLLIIIALVWWATGWIERRRRERALDK